MFDASTATLIGRASHQDGLESLYRKSDGTLTLQVLGQASEETHDILGRCPCRCETELSAAQAGRWLAGPAVEIAH